MIEDIIKGLVNGAPISVIALVDGAGAVPRQVMLSVDERKEIWLEAGHLGEPPSGLRPDIPSGLMGVEHRKDLLCEAANGSEIRLLGVRRRRSRRAGAGGFWWETLSVEAIVYGDGNIEAFSSSRIGSAESAIDGLEPWLPNYQWPSTYLRHDDGTAAGVAFELRESAAGRFVHSGFEVSIGRTWAADYRYSARRTARTAYRFGFVRTSSPDPRPLSDHFEVHSRLADLMTVVAQTRCAWHSHKVRSLLETPVSRGTELSLDLPVHLIGRDTLAGQLSPESEVDERTLVNFDAIGLKGLERWLNVYEEWARVITPVVVDSTDRTRSPDERIVSLGIALDTAGAILKPKRPLSPEFKDSPTAGNIFRALHGGILSDSFDDDMLRRVAYGIARSYNKVKHLELREVPTATQKFVCLGLMTVAVQYLVLTLAAPRFNFDPTAKLDGHVEWLAEFGQPGWFDDKGKWLGD